MGTKSPVQDMVVSSDGNLILSAESGGATLYDFRTTRAEQHLENKNIVRAICANQNGCLYAGCGDGKVKSWDLRMEQWSSEYATHDSAVRCIALVGERRVLSGAIDHTLRVTDII